MLDSHDIFLNRFENGFTDLSNLNILYDKVGKVSKILSWINKIITLKLI